MFDCNNQLYPQHMYKWHLSQVGRYDAQGYLYGMRCFMFLVTVITITVRLVASAADLSLREAYVIFKCLKGLAPPYLSKRFIKRSEVHSRYTRNRNMLQIPMRCSSTGKRSFLSRAVSLWNNLPESIRCIDSLTSFKLALKEHFKKDK